MTRLRVFPVAWPRGQSGMTCVQHTRNRSVRRTSVCFANASARWPLIKSHLFTCCCLKEVVDGLNQYLSCYTPFNKNMTLITLYVIIKANFKKYTATFAPRHIWTWLELCKYRGTKCMDKLYWNAECISRICHIRTHISPREIIADRESRILLLSEIWFNAITCLVKYVSSRRHFNNIPFRAPWTAWLILYNC